MNHAFDLWMRRGALLAINLLFLMVWGVTGLAKLRTGRPAWMTEKFAGTWLATFPGVTVSFWLLTVSELAAFTLAAVALLRGEFLARREPRWLLAMLVWSLFVFVQLGLGQWLTGEFTGAHQLFMYFCGTLVALAWVQRECWTRAGGSEPGTSPCNAL
ncbi:MAG: hypothetical protein ACKVYV_12695 [Limisphaerales bacterium]